MTTIFLEFEGTAGDQKDLFVRETALAHGARIIGSGTFLSDPPSRDVEIEVSDTDADKLRNALADAGFRTELVDDECEEEE